MARKRGKKRTKTISRKKLSPKRRKVSHSKTKSKNLIISSKRKINLVIRNLTLFFVMFLISFLLYNVLNDGILKSFFSLLSIIFVFISVAFLIIFLTFLILRLIKK